MVFALYDTLSDTYPRHTVAHALFYKNTQGKPSIRFVAHELGWELSDSGYVGPGPNGIFYYKRGFFQGGNTKLPKDRLTKAGYYVDQITENDAVYVHIKFYAPGSEEELLGEFLTRDLHGTVGASGLLQQRKEADWKYVRYTTTLAVASKEKNSTCITLGFLSNVAEVHCSKDDPIYCEAIDGVSGELAFEDLSALQAGSKSVKWSHDHVVFNKDSNSDDFIAFFLPHEPLVDKPLDTTRIASFNNITWKGAE